MVRVSRVSRVMVRIRFGIRNSVRVWVIAYVSLELSTCRIK